MSNSLSNSNRRQFIAAAAATAALVNAGASGQTTTTKQKIKLGYDNFSIRALGWKAGKLLEFAAEKKLDALLISDLDSYESLETAALRDVGMKAKDLGIELHAGTLSLCPTSTRFDKKHGTAEEHAKLLVRVAHDLGCSVARCVLGFGDDRKTPGGIRARMADMAAVLKSVKSYAQGHGVKFAIENHAGDMQGWELVDLINDAGADFVGATVDTGNATWTLESPLTAVNALAPHTLTSGIRDSMVWETEKGAAVQWTAMGEGCVDFAPIISTWEANMPEAPFILEIISGFSRPFDFDTADFWKPYEALRAQEFQAFRALAKKGKQIPSFKAEGQGDEKKRAEQAYQLAELERSITHCREKLGLGRK
jgi:3-oxoisoapionate decarboxylase